MTPWQHLPGCVFMLFLGVHIDQLSGAGILEDRCTLWFQACRAASRQWPHPFDHNKCCVQRSLLGQAHGREGQHSTEFRRECSVD
ncbi:hypothetical protein B0H11DRAFT_381036 [Mycena galericulata]|nr:hypothetical protein B0H11DRAFT_381036 [Mycena galericulata]